MSQGHVVSIHITSVAEGAMRGLVEVNAKAGVSEKPKPGRQITLIEAEAIEALERELGMVLEPGETRRNLITRGVALNHLVGREFSVGEVRLRGYELCEPCGTLARMTGKPQILPGLVHRGGLRAEILEGGVIRVGDSVRS
jgi:MOSC domain-containing protein YiiM